MRSSAACLAYCGLCGSLNCIRLVPALNTMDYVPLGINVLRANGLPWDGIPWSQFLLAEERKALTCGSVAECCSTLEGRMERGTWASVKGFLLAESNFAVCLQRFCVLSAVTLGWAISRRPHRASAPARPQRDQRLQYLR